MISIPSVCHLSEFKSSDVHIANKIVSHLYKPVDDALLVEETLRRCDMVGGNGVAASVFVLRPGIFLYFDLAYFYISTRQFIFAQCLRHFLFMIEFKRHIR